MTKMGEPRGAELREAFWDAVKDVRLKNRTLLNWKELHPSDEEGIGQREDALSQAEAHQVELQVQVTRAWD